MTTHANARPIAPGADVVRENSARVLMYAAPLAALLAGCAAEWLDFRALRYPLLVLVLFGVTLTRHAHDLLARDREGARQRGSLDAVLRTVVLGVVTWGVAETVYVLLHVVQGERFEADRFGPQAVQAIALIAAHGVFLGAPTGIAAWALLQLRSMLRRRFAA